MANKTVVVDGELSLDVVNDGEITLDTVVDGDTELHIVDEGDPNINSKIDGTALLEMSYAGEYGIITVVHDADPYTGEYIATPTTSSQLFMTNQKFMNDNFTVLEIPYAEAGNIQGGYTVTIGG